MKANILQTGELIEVEFSHKSEVSNNLFYKDIATGDLYPCSELIFTDVSDNPPIDWEQRRFELAKAATQGILANQCSWEQSAEDIATEAIRCADAIIVKLKE